MPSATREFALFGLDSTHSEPEEMEIQISHDLVSGRYLRTSESRLSPMVSGRGASSQQIVSLQGATTVRGHRIFPISPR